MHSLSSLERRNVASRGAIVIYGPHVGVESGATSFGPFSMKMLYPKDACRVRVVCALYKW
jgi:hypothetical protein